MGKDAEGILVKATVKKVSTTSAKGGTAVISFEIPIGEEAAVLLENANDTCALSVSFRQSDISKAEGQMELPLGVEPDEDGK